MVLSGEGNGNPLQYSCLENTMDGGAWWAAVHGVPRNQTWLSDFTFTFHFHTLEKEMATHSSVLAWRIPGTEEPGGLLSMGSHRVRHDWSDLAVAAAVVLRAGWRKGVSQMNSKPLAVCLLNIEVHTWVPACTHMPTHTPVDCKLKHCACKIFKILNTRG